MFLRIFLFFTVLSHVSNAQILTWDDLEVGKKYSLTAPVVFDSILSLPKGAGVKFFDLVSLSPVPAFMVEASLEPCPAPIRHQARPMAIVGPYGVELKRGCFLEIYLETRHYYSKSLLQSLNQTRRGF